MRRPKGRTPSVPWLVRLGLEGVKAVQSYRAGLHFMLQGGITQALQASTRIADLTATGEGAGAYHPKELDHMVN
jgi:hypothetical protein